MKKILIALLLVVLCSSNLLAAEVIFEHEDQTGDEFGPGTYIYPKSQVFEPYEGLFDLKYFKVEEDDDFYNFHFEFREINNPWRAPQGFSHQLIQVYIDNEKGGRTDTFKAGANVKFEQRHPWNKLIKITGWEVKVYDEGDDENATGDIEEGLGERIDQNTIKAQIPKDKLGELEQAYYYVLVGSFSPFGPDNFRQVRYEATGWEFGGGEDEAINPNVIDTLVPEGLSQKEVLGSFGIENQELAVLRAVGPGPALSLKIFIISGFLFLLLAAVVSLLARIILKYLRGYGYFN